MPFSHHEEKVTDMFSLKEFLFKEVKPALGCTEPVAVALAVARANEELPPEPIVSIEVVVSDNVYKNGMAVVIPGTSGARGNTIAAALGVICGKSSYHLEVLKECTAEAFEAARALVEEGRVSVICDTTKHGVYIEAKVTRGAHWASALILDEHTNIVSVVRDGVPLFMSTSQPASRKPSPFEIIEHLSYEEVVKLADEMDDEDAAYVLQGAAMNLEVARAGLSRRMDATLSFGQRMQQILSERNVSEDLGYRIRIFCHAAADARMSGIKLPVMSSAGSGNHGITAILPVVLVGEALKKNEREIARALIISHLSTSFVKSRLGRLSKVCGCAIAAGAGAAAGITHLLGGDVNKMAEAMKIVIVNTAGMICDGAKETCSLKVGTGAFEAYLAALLVTAGSNASIPQGILRPSLEETVRNVAKIERDGMLNLDKVIIEILEELNR